MPAAEPVDDGRSPSGQADACTQTEQYRNPHGSGGVGGLARGRDHGPAVAEQPVGARQGHIAVAGRAGGVGPGSAAVGVRGRRSPEAPEGAGGVTDTAPGTRRGSGTGRRSRGDDLVVGIRRRWRRAARLGGPTIGLVNLRARSLAAERLHREVAQPLEVDGHRIEVAMSLGVALAQPGESAESLLDRADRAMYRSKDDDPPITFAA